MLSNRARPTLRFQFLINYLYRLPWLSKSHLLCRLWRPISGQAFSEKERPSQRNQEKLSKQNQGNFLCLQMTEPTRPLIVDFFFLLLFYCKNNVASTSTAASRMSWSERQWARAPLPASKWQRGNIALNSPLEVKPQSLCPFPRDCWRSCPVAMIMRLEFDRKASNRKTYGVNLDARALRTLGNQRHKAYRPTRDPCPCGPASQVIEEWQTLVAERLGPPENLRLGSLSFRIFTSLRQGKCFPGQGLGSDKFCTNTPVKLPLRSLSRV